MSETLNTVVLIFVILSIPISALAIYFVRNNSHAGVGEFAMQQQPMNAQQWTFILLVLVRIIWYNKTYECTTMNNNLWMHNNEHLFYWYWYNNLWMHSNEQQPMNAQQWTTSYECTAMNTYFIGTGTHNLIIWLEQDSSGQRITPHALSNHINWTALWKLNPTPTSLRRGRLHLGWPWYYSAKDFNMPDLNNSLLWERIICLC